MSDKVWKRVSKEAQSLIRSLMNRNQSDRLSARQALQHPWFDRMIKQEWSQTIAKDSFNSLKEFRSTEKLKYAALVYMVAHFTSKEEEAKLRESFQQFDSDKSGKIELDEFIKAY